MGNIFKHIKLSFVYPFSAQVCDGLTIDGNDKVKGV